jgi:Sulfatase
VLAEPGVVPHRHVPSRHGVKLTLTYGDLWPDPRRVLDVVRTAGRLLASGDVPRRRLLRAFARSSLRLRAKSGREPELASAVPTVARMLRARGYEVVLKGKWHLTKPVAGDEFGPADSVRLERDYGLAGWEPPDAGGDAKAHHFGGGNAGRSGEGWDEDYTRPAERWLAQAALPEPFCLIVSLVNPHDVLGYPASYEVGGYDVNEFRDLGVGLPTTVDENLRGKPGGRGRSTSSTTSRRTRPRLTISSTWDPDGPTRRRPSASAAGCTSLEQTGTVVPLLPPG